MAERRSLVDDAAFDTIGSRAGAKRARAGGNTAKLVTAAALLLAAGGLIAWQAGLFDSWTKPEGGGTELTPDELKAKSDKLKADEIKSKDPGTTRGDS